MARLRYNNTSGFLATSGSDVTNSATSTTINFATPLSSNGVAIPTITGGNFIALVLDSGTTFEEIVYLTAYTTGTTLGTVIRGREGTSGQTHASGNWSIGSTAADFTAGGDASGGLDALTVTGINGTQLAGLGSGILKNTTGTGVPSVAVANTDYLPVANPTATGVSTAPAFAGTGLTGAGGTGYRIVGGSNSLTGPPTAGTFQLNDIWIDGKTPAIWVCTTAGTIGSGCVFTNIATLTTLNNAVELALAATTNYDPKTFSQGNTGLLVVQNQTLDTLPSVSTITANGTLWTVTFNSSILGTYGAVGDTFPCSTSGFVNSGSLSPYGWNATGLTATVIDATHITIPNTTQPGTITAWGVVKTNGTQYTSLTTPTGVTIPRAIVEVEGDNVFGLSLSNVNGIGPAIQNAMVYKNAASPYSASVACSSSSSPNLYKIAGDHRGSIVQNGRLVGNSGVPAGAYVAAVSYDGTNTNLTCYIEGTFTPANFTGTTGTYTLYVVPDIYTAEGFVNFPQTIADGAAISFPAAGTTFGKPGQSQAWANGFWTGQLFGAINGGSLAGVNMADVGAVDFLEASVSALMRYGVYVDDVQSLLSTGTGGSLVTQVGLQVGHLNPDLTLDPFYGATNNVGIINASTDFAPAQPPTAALASSMNGLVMSQIAAVAVTATSTGTNTNITITAAGTWTAGQVVYLSGFTNGITAGSYTIGTGGTGSFVVPVTGTVTATGTGNVNGILALSATTWLPASGTVKIALATATSTQLTEIAYTGIIGSLLVGCTFVSGPSGAVGATGATVLGLVDSLTLGSAFTLPVPLGSKMAVTSASAVSSVTTQVITGTPLYDGQKLKIVNVGSYVITFNSGGSTKLSLSYSTVLLQPGGSLALTWDAILGVWVQDNGTGGVVTRPVARVVSVVNPTANPTINTDVTDVASFTGMTNNVNSMTVNLTGTPVAGDRLIIQFTDNGTARTISWGTAKFDSTNLTTALPTTTVANQMLTCTFIWNTATSKWHIIQVG